jgi:hypothetical protein
VRNHPVQSDHGQRQPEQTEHADERRIPSARRLDIVLGCQAGAQKGYDLLRSLRELQ